MVVSTDPELQKLHDRLDEALAAEIPSLPEIRQRRKRIILYLAACVRELMYPPGDRPKKSSALRIIRNDSPLPSEPRGICSPIKTDELQRFEASARRVFGDIGQCETAWLAHGHCDNAGRQHAMAKDPHDRRP
jgi:hypothetical protein